MNHRQHGAGWTGRATQTEYKRRGGEGEKRGREGRWIVQQHKEEKEEDDNTRRMVMTTPAAEGSKAKPSKFFAICIDIEATSHNPEEASIISFGATVLACLTVPPSLLSSSSPSPFTGSMAAAAGGARPKEEEGEGRKGDDETNTMSGRNRRRNKRRKMRRQQQKALKDNSPSVSCVLSYYSLVRPTPKLASGGSGGSSSSSAPSFSFPPPLSDEIKQLTGITDEQLASAPSFHEVWFDFVQKVDVACPPFAQVPRIAFAHRGFDFDFAVIARELGEWNISVPFQQQQQQQWFGHSPLSEISYSSSPFLSFPSSYHPCYYPPSPFPLPPPPPPVAPVVVFSLHWLPEPAGEVKGAKEDNDTQKQRQGAKRGGRKVVWRKMDLSRPLPPPPAADPTMEGREGGRESEEKAQQQQRNSEAKRLHGSCASRKIAFTLMQRLKCDSFVDTLLFARDRVDRRGLAEGFIKGRPSFCLRDLYCSAFGDDVTNQGQGERKGGRRKIIPRHHDGRKEKKSRNDDDAGAAATTAAGKVCFFFVFSWKGRE